MHEFEFHTPKGKTNKTNSKKKKHQTTVNSIMRSLGIYEIKMSRLVLKSSNGFYELIVLIFLVSIML